MKRLIYATFDVTQKSVSYSTTTCLTWNIHYSIKSLMKIKTCLVYRVVAIL